MKIHIFGDSHSAYCFDAIEQVDVHWLGPITMHRVGRDGAGFVRERIRDFRPGDVIGFLMGEIDVRCHLAGRGQNAVEDLARRFVVAVSEECRHLSGSRSLVVAPMPPTDQVTPKEFPKRGSMTERLAIDRRLKDCVRRECSEHGVLFLPVPAEYMNDDGSLVSVRSDGGIHIAPCESAPLARDLGNMLGLTLEVRRERPLVLSRRIFPWSRRLMKRTTTLRRVRKQWLESIPRGGVDLE